MTAQFGDPQPAPRFTKDYNFHYQWSRAVWTKSLLPLGSFQEKLPCPSQGENPIGRRGSQQKELGLKG